ncbi:protoheme IX farnesyltransferase [Pullulanibacillus camelliae]|uniref:Protoheme IX farnesyltransferase n=1 Tax=Pullulanibacillus camelliae TaxID=1707096 RepID=A0A8J2YI23_9BACL|nr:heme o synthase [Pullulanibacillus camelliae]GGE44124.1 protoheme IX farnesyltransferase [Pullulanibacillus camelliae]
MAFSQTKAAAMSKTALTDLMKQYVILTKPRINALLLFTAYVAAIVASDGFPSPTTTFTLIGGLGLSAAGSAVINMWYDRDIDAIMSRTKARPLPQGYLSPNHALIFGLALQAMSLAIFLLFSNPLSAILSFSGFIYYAVIYTMWLKRRTPQNIVIGGGAGALPPLIGWSIVTDSISMTAIMMFLIIFFWTPSHFWSLALYKNEDYKRAKVPMMPVVKGASQTKIQCLCYAGILALTSTGLAYFHSFGPMYLFITVALNSWFLLLHIQLLLAPHNEMKRAKQTFISSLIYLPALFSLMVICVLFS